MALLARAFFCAKVGQKCHGCLGRFPVEFRPGDQGRVGTRFSPNRPSDFDELPSGLSLRVEDSRVAIANRQSPMSHNVPKCPLRRGTWDMGHGTGDMGHWPSGSAAMFTKCHLRPVAKGMPMLASEKGREHALYNVPNGPFRGLGQKGRGLPGTRFSPVLFPTPRVSPGW